MAIKKSIIYTGLGIAMLILAGGLSFVYFKKAEPLPQADQFTEICIAPVLAGKDVGEACRTVEHIQETYNVDIKALIENRRARLADTARRIATGELQDPLVYKACIARGDCEDVPLLPPDVDTSDPSKLTRDQLAISTAFWDLAEKDKMTKPVCDLISECRVMVKLSVVDYGF